MNALEAVFSWVLTTTWQASVLAVLVLAAQGLFGARLNPRWRYALWLLVLLRLVLPDVPESALSLFRYAPAAPLNLPETISTPEIHVPFTAGPLPLPHEIVLPQPNYTFLILAIVWLSGALGLLLLTFLVNRRFARHVANAPQITDAPLRQIFADAKAELGVRRPIRLVESSHVSSPAIMGLFTPTLLLPDNAPEKFSPRELRFIFLHELAHLKRGDVFIQALIALLQVIHWFNPVLWYAFRRLRADREPATDALVLSRTGEADKEPYGLMLLKLLEHFNQRHALPTLVGILEDKDQFKRRFSLIAKFTRGAYGWSLLGVALLALLAAVCLTKAKAEPPKPAPVSDKVLDITGTITEPDGTAVPNAKVVVHECDTRPGLKAYTPGSPDPSLDFKKTGLGDSRGRFVLGNVSHDILFTLVADAPGHGPAFLEKIDPKNGPVHFVLPALPPGQAGAPACGHLVGDQGRPVANAKITVNSLIEGDTSHYPGLVAETTSDSGGNFSIPFQPGHQGTGVEIVAPGYASEMVPCLPFNGLPSTIRLHPGVTVTGRLLDHGEPLAGIEIGVAQTDRNAETCLGEFKAKTDGAGRFVLHDVSSDDEYEIYAKRDSLSLRGVPVRKVIKTSAPGSTIDAGDLGLQPGVRLEGRITFPNGDHPALHERVQLHVSRDETLDYQYMDLGSDLSFTLLVRPGEKVNLTAFIPGYHLAAPNAIMTLTVTPDRKSVEMKFVPDEKPAESNTAPPAPSQASTSDPAPTTALSDLPPLRRAITLRQPDTVASLLDHGAVADINDVWTAVMNCNPDLPGAAKQRETNLRTLQVLAAHDALKCVPRSKRGGLLIFACLRVRNLDVVRLLLSHNFSPKDLDALEEKTVLQSVRNATEGKDNWPPDPAYAQALAVLEQASSATINPAPSVSPEEAGKELLQAKEDADTRQVLVTKLKGLPDDEFVSTLEGLNRADPALTALTEKIATEKADITNLLHDGFTADNPRVVSMRAEVAAREQQRKGLIDGERRAMDIDLQTADARVTMLVQAGAAPAAGLPGRLLDAQEDANARRVLVTQLKKLPGDQFVSTLQGLGRSDPALTELDQKIAAEKTDITNLLSDGFEANHPRIVSMRAEVAAREQQRAHLVAGLRDAMDIDLQMADSRVELLKKQVNAATPGAAPASAPAPPPIPLAPGALDLPSRPPVTPQPTPKLTPTAYHPAAADAGAPAAADPPNPQGNFVRVAVKILEIGEEDYQAHRAEIDAAVQRGDSQPLMMLTTYHELDNLAVLTKSGEQGVMEAVSVLKFPIALGKNTTGQSVPSEYARRNLGVRVMILPEVKHGRIQLTAFPEVMSLAGWVGLDTALPEPAFNIRADHLSDSFLDGESKGFPFPGGAQDVPLDPSYGYDAGTKPDPVKSRTMKGRLFYFIIVRECDRDGPASANANSVVPANGVQAPVLNPAPASEAKFQEVTVSGRLRLVHPDQVDLAKSTGYLTSVDGGDPMEFYFQSDGTFSIPHVKPGVYNRRIRFTGSSGGASEMILDPLTVDGASANVTTNLSLDVRIAAPLKGNIQIALKLVEIDDGYYRSNKARVDAAVEKADLAYFSNLQGVSMLSCPSVSTPPATKASIDIVREFPYPTQFEPGKRVPNQKVGTQTLTLMVPTTPREFVTRDVGVSAEITPTINDSTTLAPGKIVLLGKVSVCDFEGFAKSNVEGVSGMPSFNTSESNFLEQIGDGELKGVWIPGLHAEEPPAADKSAAPYASAKPGASVKRMLLFVSAARVP